MIAMTIMSLSLYSQLPAQMTENKVLTDIDGNTHDIFAYLNDGKYVVLDFFFTTCHFCQEAVPEVNETYHEMGCNGAGTIVLGIESTTSDSETAGFREQYHTEYPLISGDAGGAAWSEEWGIEGFPTFVIIKPDRTVIEAGSANYGEVVAAGGQQSACPNNWPTANFEADRTLIPAGESIIFHDLSTDAAEWTWTFYNGSPSSSNVQIPEPIVYNTPGEYSVKLSVKNRFGNEASEIKTNYIKVIEAATEPPVAYFAANQVTVIAGQSINFTDLSQGNPWIWKWWFEGGRPSSSTDQNPQGITYNTIGDFNVTLIVQNSLGADTLTMENYIHVIPSIGDEVPNAKFTCNSRLVQVNTPVYFEDQSEGYPMHWAWEFEGGDPATSEMQVIPQGVTYENSGLYDVTLAVSNPNGGDILSKHDYIVVYENYVGSYCDTLCNLKEGETAIKLGAHGLTGYLGGHNSDRITTYADKFEYYTFNEISSIIVPIMTLSYSNPNQYITFYTWDGNDPVPTTVLSEQKVYLRDLSQNYYQVINFDKPLKVDGPFYLGYSINYSSDDEVVIGLSHNRGYGRFNSLYVLKDDEWQKVSDAYDGITTSTGIQVLSCLVGVEDIEFDNNVNLYPNPCVNELTIENNFGFEKNDFIEIFDNLGRIVYSSYSLRGNKIEINTSDLRSGTYVARIFTQGKVAVEKFEKLY